MGYRVAVVGATGAVGREILKTLAERNFPVSEIVALASPRSTGKEISFGEKTVLKVQNLEKFDFTRVIPGHGEVVAKDHLTFFRGYLTDLVAAVKQAAADGASIEEMKREIAERLSSKYERGMSKYPLGQYRDRIGLNVEMVYLKVVKKV